MSRDLAELQREFLASMRGGDARDAMRLLTSERGIAPETGLAIYRHAYGARLREALDHDHPVLGLYLGDELWAEMCEGYIARHPSRVRSLRRYGESLPAFLAATAPFAASPQIAELARLERRLLDGFDAADAPRTSWASLTALPESLWPGLRLRLHPSVMRLRNAWNSVEIWQALKEEQPPPAPSQAESIWLLWRDEDRITRFRSLSTDEAIAFDAFLKGADFAEVCERLLAVRSAETVPGTAIDLLSRWCEEGIVARWSTDADEGATSVAAITNSDDPVAARATPRR